jgi:hypothetical protein
MLIVPRLASQRLVDHGHSDIGWAPEGAGDQIDLLTWNIEVFKVAHPASRDGCNVTDR